MSKLPQGWAYTLLKDVINVKYGKGLRKDRRSGQGYPVYGSNGVVGKHYEALTSGATIVIGRKGSIGEIHLSESACWPIDTTYFVDNFMGMPSKYWYYFLKSLPLAELNRATAIPGINREDIYKLSIPVPPLNEQKRIADKLDQIFAELDCVKSRLNKAQIIIKSFRQSVFNAVVDGKIISENFAEYEQIKLASIVMDSRNGISKRHGKSGQPQIVLRLADYKGGKRQYGSERKIPLNANEMGRFYLKKGDFLVVRVNGSKEIAGQFYTNFGENEFFCDHFIKISIDEKRILPEFLNHISKSSMFRDYIEDNLMTTAGQYTINQKTLLKLSLYLPTMEKQKNAALLANSLLNLADQIEEKYQRTSDNINEIQQKILTRAFSGNLVPQDPHDESALTLLERIREENQQLNSIPLKKIRTTNKNTEVRKMILSVLDTLQQEKKPLTAQSLLEKSGYPRDADSEMIEKFFLDIRKCLVEGSIVCERVQDEDVFKLVA